MKNTNGFTLLELMIAIALVGILAVAGVPAMMDTINKNRTTAQAHNILTTFNLARMEAVRRSSSITICPVADPVPAALACSAAPIIGNTDWSTGWILFQDEDGNGAFNDDTDANLCETDPNSGEASEDCLLRIESPLPSSTVFESAPSSFTYFSDGTRGTPPPAQQTMLLYSSSDCESGENKRRLITISAIGQITIDSEGLCP